MAKRDRITAADRDADLRAKDRAKLREHRARVRALRLELTTAKVRQARERRALLVEIRQALRNIPKRDRAKRAEVLKALAAKRDGFRKWWAKVLAERDRRRAELRAAELEARTWRKGSASRIREAKAQRAAELAERLDALDDEQTREVERLTDAVRGAERKLTTERADQKSMRRNAKARAKAAPKVTRVEKAREFTGGVEQNLTSALEFATWKAKRRQILAQAKRQDVTSPDGVAELVREWTEADEASALDALQNDVDRWLSAEIARKEAA